MVTKLRGLAVLALALPLGACILFSNFDGLEGGGASDAAALTDATSDVVAVDGGFGCEGALFCDRFEDGGPVPPWTHAYIEGTCAIGIEPSDAAVSPGHVLVASVPDTSPLLAYLVWFPEHVDLAGAKLTFSISTDALDPVGRAAVVAIQFHPDLPEEHAVRILTTSSGPTLEELNQGSLLHTSKLAAVDSGLQASHWSTLTLSVFDKRITVVVDGVTALDTESEIAWDATARIRISLGVYFADKGTTNGFKFRYDDVRLDPL